MKKPAAARSKNSKGSDADERDQKDVNNKRRSRKEYELARPHPEERTGSTDTTTEECHEDDSGCANNEEEEEEDRKPPAREVVVQKKRPHCRRRPQSKDDHQETDDDQFDDGDHHGHMDDDDDEFHQTYASTDDSVFSGATTASIMTPNIRFPDSQLPLMGPSTHKLFPSTKSAYSNPNVLEITNNQSSIAASSARSVAEYEEQEKAIRERILALSGSVLITILTFLYVVLPFYALLALGMAVVLSGLTGNEIYRYALTEVEHRRQHQGFGEFLPDWLFRLLTQQSLHDFLMSFHGNNNRGPGAAAVYRHLLLYFLPGLTQEQRNAYIHRLPRRHLQVLERPGVGEFMGPSFMSFLVGREGYNQRTGGETIQNTQVPLLEGRAAGSRSRREDERRAIENAVPAAGLARIVDDEDDDDSHSDLGLEIEANDLTGGLSDDQARGMARSLGLQESAVTNETVANSSAADTLSGSRVSASRRDQEEGDNDRLVSVASEEEETRVIIEAAVATMLATARRVTRPFTTSASRWATRTSRNAVASLASSGARIALFTGGIGLLGFWAIGDGSYLSSMAGGLFSHSGLLTFNGPSSSSSQQQSLWPTLVLGSGGIATVLFAANRMIRFQDDVGSSSSSSSTGGNKNNSNSPQQKRGSGGGKKDDPYKKKKTPK